MTIFAGYIIPLAGFALLVAYLALKVHWFGGPGTLAVVFLRQRAYSGSLGKRRGSASNIQPNGVRP